MRLGLLVFLAACSSVGNGVFEGVQDVDGDGRIAERFGGDDCNDSNPDKWQCDLDNDGQRSIADGGKDCNDEDPTIYWGATERCDGADNDCDHLIDADDADVVYTKWYKDFDEDGYGTEDSVLETCDVPAGYSLLAGDCADNDAARNPAALEQCDSVDHNCDGDLEAGAEGQIDWYNDLDSDGFGSSFLARACSPPNAKASSNSDDCDDTDDQKRPAGGAYGPRDEVCDGFDNDCDELVDDADPDLLLDASSAFFQDLDGDLRGDSLTEFRGCEAPDPTWVTNSDDCDDTNPLVYGGAVETCLPGDEDCDGLADAADPSLVFDSWYFDGDGDGFGLTDSVVSSCDNPGAGWVRTPGDLDDQDPAVVDGNTSLAWYLDEDGDGVGKDFIGEQPSRPVNGVLLTGPVDCDDNDALRFPGNEERCDGVDNDCDELVDDEDDDIFEEELVGLFLDLDSDGYGDGVGEILSACPQSVPEFYAVLDGDCDDSAPGVNPGANEVCVAGDEDCDGVEGAADSSIVFDVWYLDGDGDGVGQDDVVLLQCASNGVEGYAEVGGDCDDTDSQVGAEARVWYQDLDGDGVPARDALTAEACTQPSGFTDYDGGAYDCDDEDSDRTPSSVERCDPVDHDCDGVAYEPDTVGPGLSEVWADGDGDGFGDRAAVLQLCFDPAGELPIGVVLPGGLEDCDDSLASVKPGAVESCDTDYDDDCDGLVNENDPGVVGVATYYRDGDGDGFPMEGLGGLQRCPGNVPDDFLPWSEAANGDFDCHDNDSSVYPGAEEVCNNRDDDCDGLIDDDDLDVTDQELFYQDVDHDNYGDADIPLLSCKLLPGYARVSGDCDDGNVSVNPGAYERCATVGVDDNCDGTADETTAIDAFRLLPDADNDGSPTDQPVEVTKSCTLYAGFALADAAKDCDDDNPNINPLAFERCATVGVDDDCDGEVDDDNSVDALRLLPDSDGDGAPGLGTITRSCVSLSSFVSADLPPDCDDDDNQRSPFLQELCSTDFDDNCDGAENEESAIDAFRLLPDRDGDGFPLKEEPAGVPIAITRSCVIGANMALADGPTDCDDEASSINPYALELCELVDGVDVDEDCDGKLASDANDPDFAIDALRVLTDGDGDGYGDEGGDITRTCTLESGFAFADGLRDCDDGNSQINPAAQELCSGHDEDCDGLVDEADPGVLLNRYYRDDDGDLFGSAVDFVDRCGAPAGYVDNPDDCAIYDAQRYYKLVTVPSGANPSPSLQEVLDHSCDNATVELAGGEHTVKNLNITSTVTIRPLTGESAVVVPDSGAVGLFNVAPAEALVLDSLLIDGQSAAVNGPVVALGDFASVTLESTDLVNITVPGAFITGGTLSAAVIHSVVVDESNAIPSGLVSMPSDGYIFIDDLSFTGHPLATEAHISLYDANSLTEIYVLNSTIVGGGRPGVTVNSGGAATQLWYSNTVDNARGPLIIDSTFGMGDARFISTDPSAVLSEDVLRVEDDGELTGSLMLFSDVGTLDIGGTMTLADATLNNIMGLNIQQKAEVTLFGVTLSDVQSPNPAEFPFGVRVNGDLVVSNSRVVNSGVGVLNGATWIYNTAFVGAETGIYGFGLGRVENCSFTDHITLLDPDLLPHTAAIWVSDPTLVAVEADQSALNHNLFSSTSVRTLPVEPTEVTGFCDYCSFSDEDEFLLMEGGQAALFFESTGFISSGDPIAEFPVQREVPQDGALGHDGIDSQFGHRGLTGGANATDTWEEYLPQPNPLPNPAPELVPFGWIESMWVLSKHSLCISDPLGCSLYLEEKVNQNGCFFDDVNCDYDGDGLLLWREYELGTWPYLSDTDFDGCNDSEDATPLVAGPTCP